MSIWGMTPGSTAKSRSMTVGTPGYMSPEQVLGLAVDERTDMFAFGCVLYECLAGRRAYPGPTAALAMRATLQAESDLSVLPERTPPEIRALLRRCLEKSPAERPENMRAVRLELEDALGIRRASELREGGAAEVPNNLPAPATTFIGREAVLAAFAKSIAGTRLLTLLGMGGSGKTRLAIELAERQLEAFQDGAWFVDVAPLTEPERVVEALGTALGVHDEAGRTMLDGVLAWLKLRRVLLLFDNCETQTHECAALAGRILQTCPDVKLLVTSREPLGARGEALFTVPTMDLPGLEALSAAEVAGSEAVLLFTERARAAGSEFDLTDSNAGVVAEICRQLDGIPLALELAGARVPMLGVEHIRARLGDRFKLLARPGGGAPARHQTVLAVIQWSWDHLLAPEQDMFRRLAVFTGGWTLERAAAVCSEAGDEFEMLDLLTRLVERSMVVLQRTSRGSVVRYRFLESVWRFALEKLEAHPEHAALRERHLATYMTFVEQAAQALTGSGVGQAMRDFPPEEANALSALAWCSRADDGVQRGLRLAAGAQRFWSLSGRYALGRRVLEDALARDTASAPTPARANALMRAAGFALAMGDQATARLHLEESLAYYRPAGDRRGTAGAVAGLAVVAVWCSRWEEALALREECLALYTELGQVRGMGMALHNLGLVEAYFRSPDHGRARFEAALELLRRESDMATEVLCLSSVGVSLLRCGDTSAALTRLGECLTLLEPLGLEREAVQFLEALAETLDVLDRPADAARLMGAAGAAWDRLGVPPLPPELEGLQWLRTNLSRALGEAEAGRWSAEGAGLSMEQALAEARTLLNSVPPK